MRFEGKLKDWNEERGFGHIEPSLGGQEVFIHVKAFVSREVQPRVDQMLSFEIKLDPQGQRRAAKVKALNRAKGLHGSQDEPATGGPSRWLAIAALVGLCLLVALYM